METPTIKSILTEISEGKGAYNVDRLIHASNTIEDMKRLALDGIKLLEQLGEPDSMQDFLEEIMVWSNATFPESTTTAKLKHLIKEVGEVIKEVENQVSSAQRRRVREEFADVFILLLNALSSEGIHFGQLVEDAKAKMEINKTREWGTPDEHGVVEHIKDAVPYLTMQEPRLSVSINEPNVGKIISEAHRAICRRKGQEYAPTVQELQAEVDRIEREGGLS